MKTPRPTIYSLAKLLDVSPGTISRAFNTNPKNRINPETRERVLRKAKEIGYYPNTGARAITLGRTNRWGLLLPHLYNPRFVELMDHLELEAHKRSTVLFLGLGRYEKTVEEKIVAHWASGEVDGIIVDASTHPKVFEPLRKRGFPVVFLFGRPSLKFDVVDIETKKSFLTLMERMIGAGHRRIGFVGTNFPQCREHPSYRAYSEALKSRSLRMDESLVVHGDHDYTVGSEAWARWRNLPNRPTAVLCFNDVIACNLIENAKSDGVRVPEDISVAGCDDIAAAASYRLTTIRTDPAQIAGAVFALLESPSQRRGEARVLNSVIVERGSIGDVPR